MVGLPEFLDKPRRHETKPTDGCDLQCPDPDHPARQHQVNIVILNYLSSPSCWPEGKSFPGPADIQLDVIPESPSYAIRQHTVSRASWLGSENAASISFSQQGRSGSWDMPEQRIPFPHPNRRGGLKDVKRHVRRIPTPPPPRTPRMPRKSRTPRTPRTPHNESVPRSIHTKARGEPAMSPQSLPLSACPPMRATLSPTALWASQRSMQSKDVMGPVA